MNPTASSAREEILARIRAALGDAPSTDARIINRDYLVAHVETDLVELLAENLTDYRAHVHRAATPADVAVIVAGLLNGPRLVVPDGVPDAWIPAEATALRDQPALDPATLDLTHAVLTGCALAIAETGTIVLDGGPGQGRRALTLVPDHHICVVCCPDQVVASVPQALPLLDPTRPQTWIAGPSATSDIELDRVEGVHGPRRLDVILLAARS